MTEGNCGVHGVEYSVEHEAILSCSGVLREPLCPVYLAIHRVVAGSSLRVEVRTVNAAIGPDGCMAGALP